MAEGGSLARIYSLISLLKSIPSTNPVIFFRLGLHSFVVEVHGQHLFYGH